MLSTLLLLLPATPEVAPSAPPAAVQDPQLKEEIEAYEDLLKSKEPGAELDAIAAMDGFLTRFRAAMGAKADAQAGLEDGSIPAREAKATIKASDKEMELLADAVHLAFTHSKRKKVTQENLRLWEGGAQVLSSMGTLGAERLWAAFEDDKRFGDEPDLRGLFLERIGATLDYSYTERLVDLLDHHQYLFIARAADALAQFGAAPGPVRKEAVERLVSLHTEYYEAYENAERRTAGPNDTAAAQAARQEARKKYRRTGASMIRALESLTGTTQAEPLDWRRWWNKNKKDKALWD